MGAHDPQRHAGRPPRRRDPDEHTVGVLHRAGRPGRGGRHGGAGQPRQGHRRRAGRARSAAQRWAALPATGPTALVATRGADGVLPVVLPGRGELLLSRPGDAPAEIVDLRAGSAARLGRPVSAGGVVYVPDDATGRVLRYAPGRGLLSPLWITAGPASLRVIARDGLVWAHDADGPHAVVVDGDTVRSLLKYTVPSPSAVPSAAPPSAAAPPSPGPSPCRAATRCCACRSPTGPCPSRRSRSCRVSPHGWPGSRTGCCPAPGG
ncbi:hypothetical protein ACFQZ4_38595 [Catellatospora coxensis]